MEEYKNTPEGRDVTRKYADILALSRPDSAESRRRHPRMSLELLRCSPYRKFNCCN